MAAIPVLVRATRPRRPIHPRSFGADRGEVLTNRTAIVRLIWTGHEHIGSTISTDSRLCVVVGRHTAPQRTSLQGRPHSNGSEFAPPLFRHG